METENTVYLLTTGTGADGDEWNVESIHATRPGAERAKRKYEEPRKRNDGSTYVLEAAVEEWPVEVIGDDEDEVRNRLLSEVERLRAENAALREEVERWWEESHDEACTNMKDCASYGGNNECYRPRPEILKRPSQN